ncbi:MAG TPA: RDD family protein [Gaiellaceae bacterium]|nr:RDD family protein [Gaiellaceae bacterium]
MSYASRLQRLGGWLIELVVVAVLLALGLILGGSSYFAGFLIALTAIWLYFAGLESSSLQSTLSGRILGLRVTDLKGEQISFNRATVRHFAMYLSAITPFAIGYLMAFWTKRRQTLHDYLASTLVVKKS